MIRIEKKSTMPGWSILLKQGWKWKAMQVGRLDVSRAPTPSMSFDFYFHCHRGSGILTWVHLLPLHLFINKKEGILNLLALES